VQVTLPWNSIGLINVLYSLILLFSMYLFRSEYGLQGAVGVIACQDPSSNFFHFIVDVMFEHSMYRKSIPFPCNQVVVVYLLIPSEASLRFSEHRFFSKVGSLPPRPIPNLEDQGVPFCLGLHL
jgi:hypothetical protein